MACARDTHYQNKDGKQPITKIINNCIKYKGFYPSFTPVINTLSTNSSINGVYSLVYIIGQNFFPSCNGTTFVNFGSIKNLPITFYSPFNISFVVPLNAISGNYDIVVVNIYNGNFSPQVNQSYPGIQNYSNSITYTLL